MPTAYTTRISQARRISTAVYTLGATSIRTLKDGTAYRIDWDDDTIDPEKVLAYLDAGNRADHITNAY